MIPFLDLKAQYSSIKEEIDRAALGVLESAAFVLGPEVAKFEDAFAGDGQVESLAVVTFEMPRRQRLIDPGPHFAGDLRDSALRKAEILGQNSLRALFIGQLVVNLEIAEGGEAN
jgi:ectoine hydroxylase-related dioxygenase (phytanoyl-CoA dioxygenase family)